MQFKVLQTLQKAIQGKESQVEKKQLETLESFIIQGKSENVKQYLEESDAVDIFSDFSSFKKHVSVPALLGAFADLKVRYYSISSTQLLDPKIVSITIAIVRYELKNRKRKGVCSTHLADAVHNGQKNIPIYVNNNPDFRLPKDNELDILMVGPGTGLAPFRGMIQERKKTHSRGKNILFFGCRNDQDFLYKNQLSEWEEEKTIQLFVAFSRKTEKKVYVQHLLKDQADLVWNHFKNGGHFYICGDGAQMEVDVTNTIHQIFQNQGAMSEDEAQKYWKQLEKEKRIQKDTWL